MERTTTQRTVEIEFNGKQSMDPEQDGSADTGMPPEKRKELARNQEG
jgi:hypothetical protein